MHGYSYLHHFSFQLFYMKYIQIEKNIMAIICLKERVNGEIYNV